ncbi:unnamed protein product [Effrenium voratum]|nr:unnamed protein product [Effrenium voratum]
MGGAPKYMHRKSGAGLLVPHTVEKRARPVWCSAQDSETTLLRQMPRSQSAPGLACRPPRFKSGRPCPAREDAELEKQLNFLDQVFASIGRRSRARQAPVILQGRQDLLRKARGQRCGPECGHPTRPAHPMQVPKLGLAELGSSLPLMPDMQQVASDVEEVVWLRL